jgi:hypothetical protein
MEGDKELPDRCIPGWRGLLSVPSVFHGDAAAWSQDYTPVRACIGGRGAHLSGPNAFIKNISMWHLMN